MPAGEVLSERQHDDIERAVRFAEREAGLPVSVFIGDLAGDARHTARRLHATLPAPEHAALVAVDPAGKRLEVVTGAEVKHRLDDRACGLAAVSMTSAFQNGDLAGGIVTGVRMLAENARALSR